MCKLYPNAWRAHLKTRGNFSTYAEVNVQIYLLHFHRNRYMTTDLLMMSFEELEVQKDNLSISQEEQ